MNGKQILQFVGNDRKRKHEIESFERVRDPAKQALSKLGLPYGFEDSLDRETREGVVDGGSAIQMALYAFSLKRSSSEVCVVYKVVLNAIFLNCTPFNPATIITGPEALIGSEDF